MAFPWEIVYFLSSDPVLNPGKKPTNQSPPEEDDRLESLERDIVRATLRLWHGKILNLQAYVASLEKELEETDRSWADMHAQEQWLIDQIKDQVPDGVYLQALMDQEVNEMDPDFSFRKWYGENHWLLEDQPVPEYYKS